ncbi:MAG: hypothetical protein KAH26_11630 [Bacteroidales bacterium]|nr:hypothetical protein [Bacteroidales bacterium]
MKHFNQGITIVFIVLLSGCVTPNALLTPEERGVIPKGATKVITQTDKYGSDLFDFVYSTLIADGFRIDESNEDQGYISTQGKEIEQETMIRFSIVIIDSTAQFTVQWNVTAAMQAGLNAGFSGSGSGWSEANWGDTGRPSLAFAYMYKYAEKIGTVLGIK